METPWARRCSPTFSFTETGAGRPSMHKKTRCNHRGSDLVFRCVAIQFMMEKIIRDFMTIWTTIDPISNLALFASLTAAMHRSEQRRIALRVTDVILRSIGRQGAAILTRVMGIILTALSVEFVLTGLSISSWARPLH